jgi:NAD(P)H-hydrate epimerase
LAREKAGELNLVIVLKGHHTVIVSPGEKIFFNSTGNAGMAAAGSGDVLTGMLTALLAQGYSSSASAILAVYLHGSAGDMAAEKLSQESMIATDIIDFIGNAFKKFN